jgi:hypothetical protein
MTTDGHTSLADVHAIAAAVADVLAERGLVVPAGAGSSARVLNVAEVARLLGRRPAWVYEHAAELGAFRFGNGPKARIGFDLLTIEEWKRQRQIGRPSSRATNRRRPAKGRAGANLIPYEGSGQGA